VTLLRSGEGDYAGGYRLGGWGWFFRIAETNGKPETVLPIIIGATKYLFNHPPVVAAEDRTKFLWHATVAQKLIR
jgi:hypothetical protein